MQNAVVLLSAECRTMGLPSWELRVGGVPLLVRTLRALEKLGVASVELVGPGAQSALALTERYPFDLSVVAGAEAEQGVREQLLTVSHRAIT